MVEEHIYFRTSVPKQICPATNRDGRYKLAARSASVVSVALRSSAELDLRFPAFLNNDRLLANKAQDSKQENSWDVLD